MRRFWIPLSFVLLILSPTSLLAQDRRVIAGPDWTASIGANVWFSEGESRWRHHVPDLIPGLGGGSRLRFRDIESTIFGIDADFVWRRLVLTASGGWGEVDGGILVDEDFVDGFEFSRTRSPLDDGSVYFANLNIGGRVFEWRDFEQRYGFIDVLLGYQWWREEYEAFGARDELGFIGGDISRDIRVITHTWTWHGPRIGGRAYVPLFVRGLGARVNAFILPWLWVEVEDIHHLRDDLRQNPSVKSEADGGFGWQVEAALTYTFWRGLGVEAGYRWWSFEINDGTATFRPVGASSSDFDLEEVSTRRSGPFVGLYYRF